MESNEEAMLKVLGIMGSPRRQSNTEILLDKALSGARQAGAQVEKVLVSRLRISPCLEIYACLKDGRCAIEDDMQALYEKLLAADHIIFASPIFFYGITSQAKAVIDRCQALWVRRHVLGIGREDARERRGAFISVGATRGQRLFDGAILTVRYFFEAIGVKYSGDLLIRGIDRKGQIKEHPTALDDAFRLRAKHLGKELERIAQVLAGDAQRMELCYRGGGHERLKGAQLSKPLVDDHRRHLSHQQRHRALLRGEKFGSLARCAEKGCKGCHKRPVWVALQVGDHLVARRGAFLYHVRGCPFAASAADAKPARASIIRGMKRTRGSKR